MFRRMLHALEDAINVYRTRVMLSRKTWR
jgi:hypothetical protein